MPTECFPVFQHGTLAVVTEHLRKQLLGNSDCEGEICCTGSAKPCRRFIRDLGWRAANFFTLVIKALPQRD